jgi:hypothetical protein
MKLIILILSFVILKTAYAKTIHCELKDTTIPTNWPKQYRVVDYDKTINSIISIQSAPKADGTFEQFTDILFSTKENNRFGFEIDKCKSETIQLSNNESIFISSDCSLKKEHAQINFLANFSTTNEGYMKALITYEYNDDVVTREIQLNACNF